MKDTEIVALFRREMMNEIFHSSADDELENQLIQAVKNVEQLVLETIKASKEKQS